MASFENALMLCNGKVFPICPNWMCWEYGFMDGGCRHLIIQVNGKFYLIHSGYSGAIIFYVDSDTNYLVSQMGGTMWELVNGKWSNKQTLAYKQSLVPMEHYVWSDMELHYSNGYTAGELTDLPWSAPELYSEEPLTLEALPQGYLEVNEYGETGIIVGAQVRGAVSGKVTNISNEATYSVYSIGAGYASLSASRQLIINDGCPLNSIGVEITWDKLPGQTAMLTVFIKINGGDEPEDPEDPDEPDVPPVEPEDPEDPSEVTAKERKWSFWMGLLSGYGMYSYGNEQPEPTAYSYNGVILPALPEWDREMYPYAWITYNGTSDNVNYYRFIFSATPAVKRKDVLKGDILKVENTTAYIIYTDGDMTRWTLLFENNSNDNVLSTHKLLWCNEDILDNSGNVYFTASDRIPVCE